MSKVAIIADSACGIKQEEVNNGDLYILPMPFLIDGNDYYEDITLSQKDFYEKLQNDVKISTSQPSYGEVTDLWNKALENHDEVVYIPLSSGLSESYNASAVYSQEREFKDKVFVVNNQRVSITQKSSVFEALKLAQDGKSAKEIKEYLEKTKMDSTIYITVSTLKYLKRGGRVTPAAAALGTLLGIKPVLQIHGEKLDSYAKVMSFSQAKVKMINAIKKDLEENYLELCKQGKMTLCIAHTENYETAVQFKNDIDKAFADYNLKVDYIDPLPLVIACHIGPGSLAVALTRNKD